MNIKKIAIVLTALSISIVGIGAAAAQDDGTSTTNDQTAVVQRQHRVRIQVEREVMDALNEQYTGLAADALRTALHDGSTLAELIAANGMSVDNYVAEAVALNQAAIDAAVADGTLDADTAATMSAELVEKITDRVNTVKPERGEPTRIRADREASQALKEQYTGLDADALDEALRSGLTLAELIAANGLSVDDYIAESVALHQAAIDAAVADGTLDADTAATMSAELVEKITDRVNIVKPERDDRPDDGGRGGRGGQRPGGQGGNGPSTPPTDDGAGGGQA